MRGVKSFTLGTLLVVAAVLGNAKTAGAATCTSNSGCSGDTPSCVSGACVSCLTPTATCGLGLGGQACQPDGTCATKCTEDFAGTTPLATACPANLPYCVVSTGVCGNCVTGVHDCTSTSIEPVCTVDVGNASVCGCSDSTQCGSGEHCDTSAGLKGQCVSSCGTSNQCSTTPNASHCTVEDGGAGECVECVDSTTCGGGSTCDTTRHVCVFADGGGVDEPDAGRGLGGDGGGASGDDGGPGQGSGDDGGGGNGGGNGNDGGTTGPSGDGGRTGSSDGGSTANNPDATISGATSVNGIPVYDYGHVEGGACSQIPGENNSASLASSAFVGLAALAGILSIRTRRRRSNERSRVNAADQTGKSQDKNR